jgi:glutathione synthase/RimK-type ligase-like ATP-grasp enzyme
MVKKVEYMFPYPVVVKMNSGTQGKHVYLCHDSDEVEQAINKIFDPNQPSHDKIALVQEYIDIRREFRFVAFRGESLLAYEKIKPIDYQNIQLENISPLHIEGSDAVILEDENLIKRFCEFIAPIQELTNLEYGGFDIALNNDDELILIEMNSSPGFDIFLEKNSEKILKQMYSKLLKLVLGNV